MFVGLFLSIFLIEYNILKIKGYKMNSTLLEMVRDNLMVNFIYDVLKFIVAFIIIKFFYETIYMKKRWGGWKVIILDENEKEVLERELSAIVAKRILGDLGDFSIYLKGIVSPYGFLNIDISSQKAIDLGLINQDESEKKIVINLSKNPKKK